MYEATYKRTRNRFRYQVTPHRTTTLEKYSYTRPKTQLFSLKYYAQIFISTTTRKKSFNQLFLLFALTTINSLLFPYLGIAVRTKINKFCKAVVQWLFSIERKILLLDGLLVDKLKKFLIFLKCF